jgi:hypothetical protein
MIHNMNTQIFLFIDMIYRGNVHYRIYRFLLLIFRMSHCRQANLSATNLDYFRRISTQKNWAWWLNHIGSHTNSHRLIIETIDHLLSGTFVVFIIGFFGNLLCLLILCRRCKTRTCTLHFINRCCFYWLALIRNSYTQYLIALAIVDTGAILSESEQMTIEIVNVHC